MRKEVINIPVHSFVHLGITLILVLGHYSGLSGRHRAMYFFSLGVFSLLSSMFTASVLVWFSNFRKCFVFNFYFDHCVHFYIFTYSVIVYIPRCFQNEWESLG
jgi:hypothetical protein